MKVLLYYYITHIYRLTHFCKKRNKGAVTIAAPLIEYIQKRILGKGGVLFLIISRRASIPNSRSACDA